MMRLSYSLLEGDNVNTLLAEVDSSVLPDKGTRVYFRDNSSTPPGQTKVYEVVSSYISLNQGFYDPAVVERHGIKNHINFLKDEYSPTAHINKIELGKVTFCYQKGEVLLKEVE